MDPITKLWMFENWQADQMDDAELAKNHAYLLGSFWDPERVKKMLGEGANTHVSSDEEFEASTELVKSGDISNITGEHKNDGKRKRRKKIKV